MNDIRIERSFEFEELQKFVDENFDIFLFGNGRDERDLYVKNLLKSKHSHKCLDINYDIKKEAYLLGEDTTEYEVKKDLRDLLKNLFKDLGKNIFIDITSIPIPLIFCIMKEIKEIKSNNPGFVDKVFCSYTKPMEYKVLEDFSYDLSYEGVGIKPLPGFLRSDKLARKRLLVMFLGYEGNRAKHIYEEEKPEQDNLVPVIGLPSFQAGWHHIAFEKNMELMRSTRSVDFIEFVAADSPFEVFNLLVKLKNQHRDKYLVIAPIGIKTHALGVALFSLEELDNCSIIYDNTLDKENRSFGVDSCQVFDVTFLL